MDKSQVEIAILVAFSLSAILVPNVWVRSILILTLAAWCHFFSDQAIGALVRQVEYPEAFVESSAATGA